MRWESATTIAPNDSRPEAVQCGWVWFWTSADMEVDLSSVPGIENLVGTARPAG